jgi:hypothetical protein
MYHSLLYKFGDSFVLKISAWKRADPQTNRLNDLSQVSVAANTAIDHVVPESGKEINPQILHLLFHHWIHCAGDPSFS